MTAHMSIEVIDKPCTLIGKSVVATWNCPDRDGTYPSMVVLLRDCLGVFADRPYSTHIAYYADDRPSGGQWETTSGHYDLTHEQGMRDFMSRVEMP